jgi:hypothetical protein
VGAQASQPGSRSTPGAEADAATEEQPGGTALQATDVPNAREAVQRRLIDDFGAKCLVGSDVLVWIPDSAPEALDKQIAEQQLAEDGWLSPDQSWLGTLEGAARAFAAKAMFSDENETWILVDGDEGPRGIQLQPAKSATGKVVWSSLNMVGACTSTDPAVDEGE